MMVPNNQTETINKNKTEQKKSGFDWYTGCSMKYCYVLFNLDRRTKPMGDAHNFIFSSEKKFDQTRKHTWFIYLKNIPSSNSRFWKTIKNDSLVRLIFWLITSHCKIKNGDMKMVAMTNVIRKKTCSLVL